MFSTGDGSRLQEVRRGSDPARIYGIAFSRWAGLLQRHAGGASGPSGGPAGGSVPRAQAGAHNPVLEGA